ncbi:MAG TPA: hypothetical protein VNH11_36110 [Pirellulales bacterium]|nr:hypothetical protein [Pirellulales bacterium]
MTSPAATGKPVICAASAAAPDGAVYRGPVCSLLQAIRLRRAGKDVVVCDGKLFENRDLAKQIEEAAVGVGNVMEHAAHTRTAGPNALPHYQPVRRPPDGHTFFETLSQKAIL